ncbi:MAG: cation:proton antiporter [Polyangiaceae bacterium]|nr:cation:proton antiporter [Polyangiaceae bacterium]
MNDPGILFHLATAMTAALVGAFIALRLRQSVIVGYLLAGHVIGPFTPGFVGHTGTVESLAEIGIVFLMFVVGVQLSFRELVRAGRVALLGAAMQVPLTIAGGFGLARLADFTFLEALFFGAVVSNSSSTVLVKVVAERGQSDAGSTRTALAWSSVQDVSTVLLVAVLSALSTAERSHADLTETLWKSALFVGVLVPLALFALPRLFVKISALRNREIFVLAAGCVALGMSYVSAQLGVSAALGAFLAGAILGDSHLSHRIVGETMPLRDVFSGLFFVSVGMLIDPHFVLRNVPLVLFGTACIVVFKGALSLIIARVLRSSWTAAAMIGATLAQSAEFSILMARIGQSLGAVSDKVFNTMLSSTALSILIAPHVARAAQPLGRWLARRNEEDEAPPPALDDHVIVCGYGRVGQVVTGLLHNSDVPFIVIDEDEHVIRPLRKAGGRALIGDASRSFVLERAGVARAKMVIIALPDQVVARQVIEHARALNANIAVVARTHSETDRRRLRSMGINEAVLGEFELAFELGRRALGAAGLASEAIEAAIENARETLHS